MTRRIILAGAAGFVGQNLTPLLLEHGDRVVALDCHAANLALLARLNPGVETHVADLSAEGDWPALMDGADAVVDLKAQIASLDQELFRRNNVTTEQRLLEACRAHRVPHLVHLSSSVVISVAQDAYTETKREAEELVRASGVPHTVLRPPLMYGAFDVKHLGFIGSVMEKTPVLPIPGSGRFPRQPLYVLDLCRVILRALERGPSGAVHNLIGLELLPFVDLLRALARERGLRCLIVPTPLPLFAVAVRLYAWLLRRPAVTREQLDALTAGDVFPVDDWPAQWGLRYTPFAEGLREACSSPRFRHTRELQRAH